MQTLKELDRYAHACACIAYMHIHCAHVRIRAHMYWCTHVCIPDIHDAIPHRGVHVHMHIGGVVLPCCLACMLALGILEAINPLGRHEHIPVPFVGVLSSFSNRSAS